MSFNKTLVGYQGLTLALACFVSLASHASSDGQLLRKKPNIVFLFTDDHAVQAISSYNKQPLVQTPNIDRIAKEGVRFNKAYVTNSICGPSRATILTGKHSHKNGYKVNFRDFDGSQNTFPKELQKLGYTTALIGKWHLGSDPTGFDHWDVQSKKDRGGQGSYYNPLLRVKTKDGIKERRVVGYNTEIIKNLGKSWLKQQDKNEPFMLMLQFKAPHREWEPSPAYFGVHKNLKEPVTLHDQYEYRGSAASMQQMTLAKHMMAKDTKLVRPVGMTDDQAALWGRHYEPMIHKFIAQINRGYFGWFDEQMFIDYVIGDVNQYGKSPGQILSDLKTIYGLSFSKIDEYANQANDSVDRNILFRQKLVSWKYQRYMEDYLGCISHVDDAVGDVVNYLNELGLAEDTIIVYSSDQGFYLGEHGWYDKRFMYEQSLRTPLLIKWPGVTNGLVSDAIVSNLDLAETFIDIAGGIVPEDMQGRSLVPLLFGQQPKDWRRFHYYQYYQHPGTHNVYRHYGVTNGREKLIYFEDVKEWEYYDLSLNPEETINQYYIPENKAKIERMKEALSALRDKYEVPASDPHPKPSILRKVDFKRRLDPI